MKQGAIIAGYIVVAAAFFLAGRMTAPGPQPAGPALTNVPAGAPAPAPAAQAPRPAPTPPQAQPHPGQPPAIFPGAMQAPQRPVPAPSIPIPPGTVPAADPSPAEGPANAKVIVLEVSDFQCPVCKRAYEPLKNLVKDFPPGTVRLVFKQHPLEMHRNAMNAAAASMAAARQGKFWAYADVLFNNQGALGEADLEKYAADLKLDLARWKKDYADVTIRALAKAEGEAAAALGATGTPSFFINGKKEVGWASYEAVRQQVQMEAAAVDSLISQGQSLKEARINRVRSNLPEYDRFLKSPLGREYSAP